MGSHYSRRRRKRRKQELYDKTDNQYFDGPTRQVAHQSVNFVLGATSSTFSEVRQLKEEMHTHLDRFIDEFYDYVENTKRYTDEGFFTSCKERYGDVRRLTEALAGRSFEGTFYFIGKSGRHDKIVDLDDLEYIPDRYSFVLYQPEEDEVVDIFCTRKSPGLYRHLMMAMALILKTQNSIEDKQSQLYQEVRQQALTVMSFAHPYDLFNPDDRVMAEYEDKILNLLSKEATPLEVETNPENNIPRVSDEYFNSLFWEVCRDIEEGTLPYVQEFSKARKQWKATTSLTFTDEDYYFSQKASSSFWKEFADYKQSIIHSLFEVDPFKGHPMDEVIGYHSNYNQELPDTAVQYYVKTILIPNPSKFKPRAIHIACNAIQDRCSFIHRRLEKFLKLLSKTDCTFNQDRGRQFLIKISSPSFREAHGWPSVLCMDWSNATDKLLQSFQEDVLRLFFPEEIVQFWHDVSTCCKALVKRNKEVILYQQKCGQPQGLLGSFPAFAIAHHLIMLMTMKASGLEMYKSEDFYRILGDDSAISSIVPDPTNKVGDWYTSICAYANLDIERSKSVEILADQETVLADFAKTTICNGEYYSPLPVKLAYCCGNTKNNYYAYSSLLWMHGKFSDVTEVLDEITLQWYGHDPDEHQIITTLIHSGVSERFADFEDPLFEIPDNFNKIRLAYLIAKVKMSVAQTLFGDKAREKLALAGYEVDNAITNLIPEDLDELLDHVESKDHKIFVALAANLAKEDALNSILGITDCRTLLPSLKLKDEEYELLININELTAMIDYVDIDNGQSVTNLIDTCFKGIDSLERFNMRSIYKRSAVEAMVFEQTILVYRKLFSEPVLQVPV